MSPQYFQTVFYFLVSLFLCATAVHATPTDLASAPINYLRSTKVLPNIMFILDDSGSMQWSYMGDEVAINNYENKIGYRSHLCNKIFFNPRLIYTRPVYANGSPYPQQNFFNAMYDGFLSDAIRIDLSREFMAWRSSETSPAVPAGAAYTSDCWKGNGACATSGGVENIGEAAYYFDYKGNQRTRLGDNSSEDHCKDTDFDFSTSGISNWTKVTVQDPAQRENFANWFSYHRTRILTMKSAVTLSFRELDDNFRVGFSTISYSGIDSNNANFLAITKFDATQKEKFYNKLVAIKPVSSTPLRAALAKAGQLYAGKLLPAANDPVQYSCQRNFSILSTDGYWNTGAESPQYGPKKIDGITDVGNQDNTLERPRYDGAGNLANSHTPIIVARLTVSLIRDLGFSYTWVKDIKIGGRSIVSQGASVLHTGSTNDVAAEAANLADYLASVVRSEGYRASAEDNVIYLSFTEGRAIPADVPVVIVEGSLNVTAEAFREIPTSSRSRNTLADVAAYYYQTDLRNPADNNCRGALNLCPDTVQSASNSHEGRHQHMVTYTLGLGANGVLRYQENYDSAPSGDFHDIASGDRNWPDPIYFNGAERIDDLWHAAVNGGGKYFNAQNTDALASSLSTTLRAIRASTSASASATTSSQELTKGDDTLFITRYRSVRWDGELEARKLSLADGSIGQKILWSAQALLDKAVSAESDTRTVLLYAETSASRLKPFRWRDLDTAEQTYFTAPCRSPIKLSQCERLPTALAKQAGGERLINFLRGQHQYEDRPANIDRLYREREHVLGALINAQPVFVGRPAFRYVDANYAAFRDGQQASRKPMLYAAANDGMLHAFNAGSGLEEWAFIPRGVLPNLIRLADQSYATNFRYLLDGSPVVGDICPRAPEATCDKTQWSTILVGGLAAGGREYYALDVTDPDHPKALWRFGVENDADMGFSLGKPIITKQANGRWIIVVASGYNNISPGDGEGHLFVLDAATGEKIKKLTTGAGGSITPSGLAQINAWVDSPLDNTALRFYGGDLLGNLWRFDIDDRVPPAGQEAVLLANFMLESKAQPITTRPELSEIRLGDQAIPVISVTTGKYLGISDLSDISLQSIYSIKDELVAQSLVGDARTNAKVIRQSLRQNNNVRTISSNAVNWKTDFGWYVDFIVDDNLTGERVTIDPQQQLGILRVVSNTPTPGACGNDGSSSWIYSFDYRNGQHLFLARDEAVGKNVDSHALIAGVRTVKSGDHSVILLTDEAGNVSSVADPSPSATANAMRRVSWRELDD